MKNATFNANEIANMTPAQKGANTRQCNKIHAEALELNEIHDAMQVVEAEQPKNEVVVVSEPVSFELSKEQRLDILRTNNAGETETARDMAQAFYKQKQTEVEAGQTSAAEAVEEMRTVLGTSFSAEFFSGLDFDGMKSINAEKTAKDPGRAVKGSEGRWTFKFKEISSAAFNWAQEHLSEQSIKDVASTRPTMNRVKGLLELASNSGHKAHNHECIFVEKLKDQPESIRLGYLRVNGGAKGGELKDDTYPKNLAKTLRKLGAAQLISGGSAIKPDYNHPLIKALAA